MAVKGIYICICNKANQSENLFQVLAAAAQQPQVGPSGNIGASGSVGASGNFFFIPTGAQLGNFERGTDL